MSINRPLPLPVIFCRHSENTISESEPAQYEY
jgi:hypothetical protein